MRVEEIDDDEWRENVLEKVEAFDDHYVVTFDGGLCFSLPKADGIVPKAGDTFREYGRGFGYTVRGAAVNGAVVFYKTREQEKAEHDKWCADEKAKKIAEYEANKDDYARRVALLPPELRSRFDRFARAKGDSWWPEYGPYELFCCEQAAAFAEAFKGDDAGLLAWQKMPHEEQRKRVPAMDDGHSGNTFGFAVRLAHWLLTKPEIAAKDHGALVMLVGCEAYGCEHEKEAS